MTNARTHETITVPTDTDGVSCDGGGGALGHPKVWYGFNDQKNVHCLYCDRVFIREN
ncbi:MAG: zinc-finger domain-containing protein [Alphaproteobacteria bacterium]|nr:zinc-finger domain-containing protein [Alphaproteobacteria bacterium]